MNYILQYLQFDYSNIDHDFLRNVIMKIMENIRNAKPREFVDILASSLILFIMPYEKIYKRGRKISLYGFDRSKIEIEDYGNSLNDDDLFRKLRNGLAHFNIRRIDSDPTKIEVWDERNGNIHFKAKMKYDDFKDFVLYIGRENLNILNS